MARTRCPIPNPSPWQSLVGERIDLLSLTSRYVSSALSTPRRAFANTTIWAWLRSPDGGPPPRTYTKDLNKALAKILAVSPDELAAAYDKSRMCFDTAPNDTSAKRMGILRRMFDSSAKETWTKAEIVTIIDEILEL